MNNEKSCLHSHGALVITDEINSLVSNISQVTENKSLIDNTTLSIGTSDETIVRRGDGKVGRHKENTLKSNDVGKQNSDLRLAFPSPSKLDEPVKEEEYQTYLCCCPRRTKQMMWL